MRNSISQAAWQLVTTEQFYECTGSCHEPIWKPRITCPLHRSLGRQTRFEHAFVCLWQSFGQETRLTRNYGRYPGVKSGWGFSWPREVAFDRCQDISRLTVLATSMATSSRWSVEEIRVKTSTWQTSPSLWWGSKIDLRCLHLIQSWHSAKYSLMSSWLTDVCPTLAKRIPQPLSEKFNK